MIQVPRLIDAHTHIQFAVFDKDRDEVIKRALAAGVWLVNVGSQKDTSRATVELAERYETGVYAAVGLHPIHTGDSVYDADELGVGKSFSGRAEEFDYEYYRTLASHPKVVAVGECGLDFYRVTSDKKQETSEKQKEVFIKQVELSQEIKKPLMVHCRDAYEDLIKILKANSYKLKTIPGIIHFFSGTVDQARKFLDLGFYFTFGGVITFSKAYDGIVKYIPLDRIMVETDAPYVAPAPYRGQRNEPVYIEATVKKMAELKGLKVEEIGAQIVANARAVFDFKA